MRQQSKHRNSRASQSRLITRRSKSPAAKVPTVSGLVEFYVHGQGGPAAVELKGKPFETANVVEAIKRGLPVKDLGVLQVSLDLPIEQLAPKLGISRATLHRRKAQGTLGRHESDRVVRFARLIGKAIEVFETEENARRWLRSPQVGLGGAVPLDYAETEIGSREVEELLGRIEYGVYS